MSFDASSQLPPVFNLVWGPVAPAPYLTIVFTSMTPHASDQVILNQDNRVLQAHVAISGDVFGCHHCKEGVQWASTGWNPGILPNCLQCRRRLPRTKNLWPQMSLVPKLEKPGCPNPKKDLQLPLGCVPLGCPHSVSSAVFQNEFTIYSSPSTLPVDIPPGIFQPCES